MTKLKRALVWGLALVALAAAAPIAQVSAHGSGGGMGGGTGSGGTGGGGGTGNGGGTGSGGGMGGNGGQVGSAGGSTASAGQLSPEASGFFRQALAYEKEKKWYLAIAAYGQVVRLEPKFAPAWNNMGFCYRKVQQFDQALNAYNQAITLAPDFVNPHEYLARTYLAMGNKDAAMRECEIVRRLDPSMGDELMKAIQANNPDLGDDE